MADGVRPTGKRREEPTLDPASVQCRHLFFPQRLEALVIAEPGQDLVALDDALEALLVVDARKARVIEVCFFSGLSSQALMPPRLSYATSSFAGTAIVARSDCSCRRIAAVI